MRKPPIIGIDLGTTNSCAAIVTEDGSVKLIPYKGGDYTVPSVFAIVMGIAVVAWYHDWRLGAVIGAAMICNLIAAALAGTLIPLGLQKFGVDPAVSSTVFLTTVTDVIGFLAFLGLATAFLL